jgi:hypothetical protein
LALRRALDAKRKGGLLAFLAECRAAPSSVTYIIETILRDKIALLANRM